MDKEIHRLIPINEMLEDDCVVGLKNSIENINYIDNPIERIDCPKEGGILLYRKGDKYPSWGWPFQEAIIGSDITKRSALNIIRFITSSPMRYFMVLFYLLPEFIQKKIIHSAVDWYSEFVDDMYRRLYSYLKPQYDCPMVKEIKRAGEIIAKGNIVGLRFLKVVGKVLDSDDAYRYRVQDLFELINIEALMKNPGKELKRVFLITASRGNSTSPQFRSFAKIIPLITRIRFIKNIIKEFFSNVDINKLKLDDYDWYKCLIWNGYDFRGVSFKERVSIRMMIDAQWQEELKVKLK